MFFTHNCFYIESIKYWKTKQVKHIDRVYTAPWEIYSSELEQNSSTNFAGKDISNI